MNILVKFARTGAYVTLIVGLAGLPVATMAQQDAIAEYNRDRGDKNVAVVDENRELREAIDRLDSRIRCLEVPRNTCVSQSIGSDISDPDSKSVPTRDF